MTTKQTQQNSPTPYRWEYHPVENAPVALIGPDGKDAMLATSDLENVYFEFSSEEMPRTILRALNSHASLVEALAATCDAIERLHKILDDEGYATSIGNAEISQARAALARATT